MQSGMNTYLLHLNRVDVNVFYTGKDVASVLQLAMKADKSEDSTIRDKVIKTLANRISRSFSKSTSDEISGCHHTSLTALYLLTKLLYGSNVILQLLLIHWFLDTKYQLFGIELIADLIRGKGWNESGVFPRVTLCDFEVRVLGNMQR